jgi:hypothetical protein
MAESDETRIVEELVFHESFDSVRARSGDPNVDPNLAQVQAEALLTLLLGRSVVMSNSMAFDSRSALYLLKIVFDAARRAGVSEQLVCGVSPFVVRIHKEKTFNRACIDQLLRLEPGKRFILSAWQHLTDKDDERQRFADLLARLADEDITAPPGPLDVPDLPTGLPSFIRDVPLALEQFQTLRAVNAYLRANPRAGRPTVPPRGTVTSWVTDILRMGLPGFLQLAEDTDCPAEHARTIFEAIKHKKPEDTNRTWAYGNEIEEDLGENAYLLRELVDTLQNVTLASSAAATNAYLSTPPRNSNVVELAQVNRLALMLTDRDQAMRAAAPANDQRPEAPMSGLFDTVGTTRDLNVRPLSTIYEAYWSLMADEDSRRAWRNSSVRVNSLLRSKDGSSRWRGGFAAAWAAHIALLQQRIGAGVMVSGGDIRVEGIQGGCTVVQTHTPGGLEWNDMQRADAAGEYLDMLVRAAR